MPAAPCGPEHNPLHAGRPQDGQQGIGPHRQGDMPGPTCPTAHLVLVQPNVALRPLWRHACRPPLPAVDLYRSPRPVRHRPCVPGLREPSDCVVDVTVPASVWERGQSTQRERTRGRHRAVGGASGPRPWCHYTSSCPGSHVVSHPLRRADLSAPAAGGVPLLACPAERVTGRSGRETTPHGGRAPGRAERWHRTCTRSVQQRATAGGDARRAI
jgi:hypothetical protein